jgi:hypothetical protein
MHHNPNRPHLLFDVNLPCTTYCVTVPHPDGVDRAVAWFVEEAVAVAYAELFRSIGVSRALVFPVARPYKEGTT